MENIVSALILFLLLYGRSLRFKNTKKHIQIMSIAIALDVALVIYLVLARKALSKVELDMPLLLYVHITFALTTVLGYGFAVYFGVQLKKGLEKYRSKLIAADRVVIPCRVLTLVTSLILYFTA